MFSEEVKSQILERGSEPDQVEQQIQNFVNGFPFLDAKRAASIGDGILRFSEEEVKHYCDLYAKESLERKIIKFVPASGAASRMFKELFAFLDSKEFDSNEAMQKFIYGLENFAFHEDLKQSLADKGIDIDKAMESGNYSAIVEDLLSSEGLDYGSLPKGLLKFHNYGDTSRTPAEEHFSEGASYAVSSGNNVHLHFTVSPEHQSKFEAHVAEIKGRYEEQMGVTFHVTFSQQKNQPIPLLWIWTTSRFWRAETSCFVPPVMERFCPILTIWMEMSFLSKT